MNRIIKPLPFAAFHKMPVKKACVGLGTLLFIKGNAVHGVITVLVGWCLGTVQKIGCVILKEEYGSKQSSQWVD